MNENSFFLGEEEKWIQEQKWFLEQYMLIQQSHLGREVAKGLDSYLELGPGAIVLGKGDGSPEVFYDLTPYGRKFQGDRLKQGMVDTEIGILQIPDELRGDEQGSSGDSYFAKLHIGSIGAKRRQPEGVRVQLQDIEVAIPEDLYQNLLERRGEGTAYGKVTIELYVRNEERD